jgi:hypothetical protein
MVRFCCGVLRTRIGGAKLIPRNVDETKINKAPVNLQLYVILVTNIVLNSLLNKFLF